MLCDFPYTECQQWVNLERWEDDCPLSAERVGNKRGCTDLLFDIVQCCKIDYGDGHTTDYIKKC